MQFWHRINRSSLDKYKVSIRFGDKEFVDVTNETCTGPVFTLYEAKIYGEEGRIVATSE